MSPRYRIVKLVAVTLALFFFAAGAEAVIKVLTPLRNIFSQSNYIVLAKVDKFFPDKPAMMLTVSEDYKGKAAFRRLPVNIKSDDKEADKEEHIPKLLKRLGPDLPIILFVNERAMGKKLIVYAFTNGTWFTMHGQKTGEDTYSWSLTNGEPYLRRTFKGTTDELKKIVVDSLADKAKPPEANPKEEPGFGPEIEKKKGAWNFRFDNRGTSGPLLGVIPTVVVGGPLAILAILFPSVFGAMPTLLRRWLAYITVISVISLLLTVTFLAPGLLRGWWIGTPAGTWFAMTIFTAVSFLWAWRRQMKFVSTGEDELPVRTERNVLLIMSLAFAAMVVFYIIWMEPKRFQSDWNVLLVLSIGLWFATLVRVCRDVFNAQSLDLSCSTEGLILGGALVAFLAYAAARWGTGDAGAAAVVYVADNPNTEGYVEDVKERWTFKAENSGFFVSTGLVDGDRCYMASAHTTFKRGMLYCLDRLTGKKIWEFDDDGDVKQCYSSPTIADGRLYIGEGFHDDGSCKMYCVDVASGNKIWHFQTEGQTEATPVVANGKVYFGAGNDGVFCVNSATKEKVLTADSKDTLWRFPKRGYKGRLLRFGGTAAVAGNRVYLGTGVDRNQPKDKGETALVCLDADSGEQKWKVAVDLPCWGGPVVTGDEVFFVLGNGDIMDNAEKPAGAVLCLDAATGKEKWRTNLGNGVLNQPMLDQTGVYVGCRDGNVYCLDRKTGKEKWKRFMVSPVVASVALAGDKDKTDTVIAAATDGWVCGLNAATGDIQWKVDLTPKRVVLVSSPQVVVERTRTCERRQIYFGAGINGSIQGGDAGSGPAVVYCLDNRLVERAPENKEE